MGNKILKHLSIFFIFFLLIFEAFPQSVLFNKIYPKPIGIDLEAVAAYQLESGNYFVIARHDNGSYFARMDSFGNKIWESFNNDGLVPHYSIKRQNENFLISGDMQSGIFPVRPFLREIDTSGNTIWTNQFNFFHESIGWTISSKLVETNNKSIKLISTNEMTVWSSGNSHGYFPQQSRSYFIQLDSNGNQLDSTILYGSYAGISEALDSGFILVGAIPYISGIIQPNDTVWNYKLAITKLNNNGDSMWSKTYGYPRYQFESAWLGCDVLALDSSYLVLGNTSPPFEAGTTPGFIDHFNIDGNPAGNPGQLNVPVEGRTSSFIMKTKDNGIIIGKSQSYCDNPGDCFYAGAYSYFMKYDSTFNQEWADSGSVSWFGTKSISETKNGGYIAVGNTSQYNYLPPWDIGRLNLWNYDSLGNSISALNSSIEGINRISVYPNPTLDQLNFNLSSSKSQFADVEIFSLQGDLLYRTFVNEESYSIDISSLSPGIYIYKIVSENYNSVGRFIKQ